MFIRIENEGCKVIATNWWSLPEAKQGYMYVSINAGAFRILLPDRDPEMLREMRTAEYVIVTRGVLVMHGHPPVKDGLEFLFEDHSDSPFSIHVSPQQVDRLIPASDEGRTDLACLVYTEGPTLELELPARYRRAERLPYLKPWR